MKTHQQGFVELTRGLMRLLTVGACLGAVAAVGPAGRAAVANSECLDCHAADESAPATSGVRLGAYTKSVHGDMACVDCHDTIKEASHDTPLPKVQCSTCHADTGATHAFHARLSLTSVPPGPDTLCAECHGTHETMAVKGETFAFAPATQAESCGRCHEAATKDFLASAHAIHGAGTPDCL
ncbi:MAG TPA: hypothetical protein VIK52_13420, partial [Opitutaceae bacterium]